MNRASLKVSIRSWLENDSAEFISALDDIVLNGELRVLRDLDLERFDKTKTETIEDDLSSVPRLSRPADIISTRNIFLADTSQPDPSDPRNTIDDGDTCLKRPYSEVYQMARTFPAARLPAIYAEADNEGWIFAPRLTGNVRIVVRGIFREGNVFADDDNETWISSNVPDVLLYSCLVDAAIFNKMESQDYMQEYVIKMNMALRELGSERRIKIPPRKDG